MVNEAFWFFYLVSLSNTATIFFGVLAALTLFVSLVVGINLYCDATDAQEERIGLRFLKVGVPIGLVFLLISSAIPPKEAYYAGAGQHVAESTEVDHTLLQLKQVLDKRIAEELGDSPETAKE